MTGAALVGPAFELYRHRLRLGLTLPEGAPENLRHPVSGYTLSNAIELAISEAMGEGCASRTPIPASLVEVRDYLQRRQAAKDCPDVTGAMALEVLDAAIDGTPINAGRWSRFAADGYTLNASSGTSGMVRPAPKTR